jgi:archaemetzincin
MARCNHDRLHLDPSPNAVESNFKQISAQKRIAATTLDGRVTGKSPSTEESRTLAQAFPGPLILPGDDLSYDPDYSPQSVRAWKRLNERNTVSPERKTIYVASPPDTDLTYVREWSQPATGSSRPIPHPSQADIVGYLGAFYNGMPVKELPGDFSFVEWDDNPKSKRKTDSKRNPRGAIALARHGLATRIRSRSMKAGKCYTRQLNLEDLLDALMENLPEDAYALLLVVDHDLYENEEDDFCCGRAYGGSRISVVSTARYNPLLDEEQDVERDHAWPASHCADYVESACNPDAKPKKKKVKMTKESPDETSPVRLAVDAYTSLPPPSDLAESEDLTGLWLSRVCKTASHELGHCMGFDHCVYYACVMQSTANLTEDARQPPYLCSVDLNKMLFATGEALGVKGKADEVQRYEALLTFCDGHREVHLFAAFGAWIRGRLGQTRQTTRVPLRPLKTAQEDD